MQKQFSVEKQEIKLVGIKVRTNNQNELAPENSKIFPCVMHYFHQNLFNKISFRKSPGTTFCAYTEYESDHTGDYSYFIGEEVSSFKDIPADFETLTIPPQKYTKFTAGPGSMPRVLRDAWKEIWETSEKGLDGKRKYTTDFEIYDERASDHNNIVFDIFIAIS